VSDITLRAVVLGPIAVRMIGRWGSMLGQLVKRAFQTGAVSARDFESQV